MALEKTHAEENSDNNRTNALRDARAHGENVELNQHLVSASIDEAIRARDATHSQVTDGAIVHAAIAQVGELFALHSAEESARKAREYMDELERQARERGEEL
jgi:translation elongation factor EF-Ts